MSKTISHYVARFDMPGYKKGEQAHPELCKRFPDVFEPVYKEDPVMPPGILSFIDKNGSPSSIYKDIEKTNPEFYKRWILRHQDDSVLTISVKGTEWSVGEVVQAPSFLGSTKLKIKKFIYSPNVWLVEFDNGCSCYVANLVKLPTRTPICQLPDENGKMVGIYSGPYWYVNTITWKITKDSLRESDKLNAVGLCMSFATLAAAEKYVFDKQPFYPRRDVELIMDYYEAIYGCTHPISNLKAFKEKHLKDKV